MYRLLDRITLSLPTVLFHRTSPRARVATRASIIRALVALGLAAAPLRAQQLLVPMDDGQTAALKAYGLTFNALRDGNKAEWLINYRGGAFLLPDTPDMRKRATLDGIKFETANAQQVAQIRHL